MYPREWHRVVRGPSSRDRASHQQSRTVQRLKAAERCTTTHPENLFQHSHLSKGLEKTGPTFRENEVSNNDFVHYSLVQLTFFVPTVAQTEHSKISVCTIEENTLQSDCYSSKTLHLSRSHCWLNMWIHFHLKILERFQYQIASAKCICTLVVLFWSVNLFSMVPVSTSHI